MINIITSFYISKIADDKNILRNKELRDSLLKNMAFPLVKKIHLFIDDNLSKKALDIITDKNPNKNKIVIISIGKKPMYSDLFEYAINKCKNEICMVTNSDIYLLKCEKVLLDKLLNNNWIYALTRHEHNLTCPLINKYLGSHDSFLFKSPIDAKIVNNIKHFQHIWGSEAVVIDELFKLKYQVFNPCKQIMIVHLHSSQLREKGRPWIKKGLVARSPPIILSLEPEKKIVDNPTIKKLEDKLKVISFSLWGNNINYLDGALKNADMAKIKYPDFQCWFYIHKGSVPQEYIDKLMAKDNVRIFTKQGDLSKNKPMTWRFEAIDDPTVEIMLSRDVDTRIYDREVQAVNDWIKSGKLFHIMRDHPHHKFSILGGMFGSRKIPNFKWKPMINEIVQKSERNYDQDFLAKIIYPKIKNNCMIHASFNKTEGKECLDFPIPYDDDFHFVGEYVYADESRSPQHINILKGAIKKK